MFSDEIVSMPPIPRLLGDILAHMFSTNVYRLEAWEGKEVGAGVDLVTVPFRRFWRNSRTIESPTRGIVVSSQDSRVGEDWCLIVPMLAHHVETRGDRLYEDFAKGFWPMKPSVYRYAQPALDFSIAELEDALDELRASQGEVRPPRQADVDAIDALLANPRHEVRENERTRDQLREMATRCRATLPSAGAVAASARA